MANNTVLKYIIYLHVINTKHRISVCFKIVDYTRNGKKTTVSVYKKTSRQTRNIPTTSIIQCCHNDSWNNGAVQMVFVSVAKYEYLRKS